MSSHDEEREMGERDRARDRIEIDIEGEIEREMEVEIERERVRTGSGLSTSSFKKSNATMGGPILMTSFKTNYLPKAQPLNSLTLQIGAPTYELWGDTFSPYHSLKERERKQTWEM